MDRIRIFFVNVWNNRKEGDLKSTINASWFFASCWQVNRWHNIPFLTTNKKTYLREIEIEFTYRELFAKQQYATAMEMV